MARGLLNLGANVGVHAPGRVSGIAGILAVEAYPPVAHVKRRRFTCIRGNPHGNIVAWAAERESWASAMIA